MSKFIQLIRSLVPHIETQAERDAAYLDESVDIYDLERRMREIEARGRGAINPL